MLRCSNCASSYPSVNQLISHLLFFHQCMRSDEFRCGQPPVDATCANFFSLSALKVHFTKKHEDLLNNNANQDVDLNDAHGDDELNNHNANVEQPVGAGGDPPDGEHEGNPNERINLENFLDLLYSNAELFVAQLYSLPSSNRKMVGMIVSATSFLFASSVELLKDSVFNVLSKFDALYENFDDDVRNLEEMFKALSDPLEFMDTEYKRLKTLASKGAYIAPEPFAMGSVDRYVSRRDRTIVLVDRPVSGYFIPLRKVLKYFLELPGVFHSIMELMAALERAPPGSLTNIVQGKLWRDAKQSFGDKIVLPLDISFDDYEPDNTLGSHKGDNALGALYAQISCLPDSMASSLDNFFLFCLFQSKYRKKFGNTISFECVVEELKFLHNHGITLEINNNIIQVCFRLAAILGDNSGVNEIEGFVGSFRANFYCRTCKLHRNVMCRWCLPIPENRLRTVENYGNDVDTRDSSLTGVVEKCVFNKVPGYHCITNNYGDALHDIYHGMLKYDLCNILHYLIVRRGYFSIETLRERVAGFDYGPSEFGNKPPSQNFTVEKLRDCSVNLSASEWLCLGRYLGVIIGDLVPDTTMNFGAVHVWKLYVILREILMIIVSPTFKVGIEDHLQVLIQEHHEMYIHFFGDLKPKHHFMMHYPNLLKLYGPLVPLSALKCERNHRKGKIYAKNCNNRIDFAFSTAVKLQLILSERLLRVDNTVQMTHSKVLRAPVHSLLYYDLFMDILPNDIDFVDCVNSVTISGTIYTLKMVVVLSVNDLHPVFGTIAHILLYNGSAAFVVRKLRSIDYDGHTCCYIVDERDVFEWIEQKELLFFTPLWLRRLSGGGEKFVCLKHVL